MIKKLSILSFLLLFSFFSVNATLTTNLQSYYSFDNGNTNDDYGTVNLVNMGTSTGIGILGSSRHDANNGFMYTNDVSNININSYTFSMWAKRDTTTDYDNLIGRWGGGASSNVLILRYRALTNYIGNFVFTTASSQYGSDTIPATSGNGWHHIVSSFDGNNIKLYYDGVLQQNTVISNPPINTPSCMAYLTYSGHTSCSIGGGNYLNGDIDELGIWNRALTQSEVTKLYNNGAGLPYSSIVNPINLIVNTPIDNFNYTYDVPSVLFNVSTDISTSCSYTYNNVTTLFSNTGGFNHSSTFNLPAGINQSQTFNIEFGCTNTTYSQYKNITFYKQQVPLALDIIVPKENQIFNIDTSQIEFYLQTNYVTDCNYKRDNNTIYTPFTSSHSWEHKTNFTTDLNVSTYNMNFFCTGVYVNENVSRNITFFLDELNKYGSGLTMTTSQLPQVGNDIGGFMKNSTPGITDFIFNLGIVSILVTLLVVVVSFVKKGLK